MNKTYFIKAFKIALAAVLSILTANFLQLKYAVTAGIITVLSIQNTKKETLRTARNRALAFACALFLAFICYRVFNFTILAFIIYLFLFSLVCFYAKWPEAIAMDSVLISHFLAEKSFGLELVINEILLFIVGTMFGILINLHLHKQEKEFEKLAVLVDEEIKGILHRMAKNLCKEDKQEYNADCFILLTEKIENAKTCALKNWNNTLRNDSAYEMEYIKMRESQSRILKNIYQSIIMVKTLPSQTHIIAEFLSKVEMEYHRDNDVYSLLTDLKEMHEKMRLEELPETREEFEARAVLFYMMKQLEEFLWCKYQFVHRDLDTVQ